MLVNRVKVMSVTLHDPSFLKGGKYIYIYAHEIKIPTKWSHQFHCKNYMLRQYKINWIACYPSGTNLRIKSPRAKANDSRCKPNYKDILHKLIKLIQRQTQDEIMMRTSTSAEDDKGFWWIISRSSELIISSVVTDSSWVAGTGRSVGVGKKTGGVGVGLLFGFVWVIVHVHVMI